MGGYKFTRVDRSCTKGSRLDRFLIADSTWNHLGPMTAVALGRTISDHHPILLRRFTADYGPIPFKIYHSWFQGEGFDNVVSEFWSNGYYRRSSSSLINFKNKLQGLKGAIKVWVNARRSRIERRPLRGGIEDDQYNKICDIVKQVTIVQSDDSWRWCCDTMDSFSVNGVRKHLDCLSLPSHYLATRWNKIVPRKVNIHVWRLIKDRLPTRFNLWFRGIDNVSLICPMCSNGLESIYHTMCECIIAVKVWKSVAKWLDLNLPFQLPPIEFLDFVNSQGNLHKAKDVLFTIIYTAWWELWRFRNESIFRLGKKRDVRMVDSIIHFLYIWYQNRYKKASMRWDDWFKNPLLFI
ncbi:reverse transcriptase domain, Reverse transcriptase zinc-binding domain protein [Artemisia annua]|uniref:Reverse transcriptase domain, Reverse transcriptase zinc-binding domain protein n=1 Tax=Artemisia annua TaxID=35608 RepID=A0A2U1N9U9_ARTAN|nr:reverse transcriptase domain, Reverse transcriptase zinc-binding domain protein [Artemisia annua]